MKIVTTTCGHTREYFTHCGRHLSRRGTRELKITGVLVMTHVYKNFNLYMTQCGLKIKIQNKSYTKMFDKNITRPIFYGF
jgi:hypothetical protein